MKEEGKFGRGERGRGVEKGIYKCEGNREAVEGRMMEKQLSAGTGKEMGRRGRREGYGTGYMKMKGRLKGI